MFTQRFLVSALLLGCGAIPASATLTTYTDLPTFTSATSGQTFQNITFPSGSDGTTYTDPTSGVVFSDITGLLGASSPSGWATGSTLEANHCTTGGGCTLTISLPGTVTSVGLFVGTDNFQPFQISVSNGTDPTFSANQAQNPATTPFFFGFNSTVPFSTFTISSEDNVSSLFLDSMEIGTSGGSGPTDPSDTPEAATLLMIGSGLTMLHCGRRWMPRAR